MHRASGSLLHLECTRGKLLERSPDMSQLHSGKIRFFTSKELLRIFGFPDSFDFPHDMPLSIRYRLIGQSINVLVVRALMHSEFCNVLFLSENRESLVSSEHADRNIESQVDVLTESTSEPLIKKQRII